MRQVPRTKALWLEVGAVVGLALLPNVLVPAIYGTRYWTFDLRDPLLNFHQALVGLGPLLPVLFILWASGDPWKTFGLRKPRLDIDLGIAILVVLFGLFVVALFGQIRLGREHLHRIVFFPPEGLAAVATSLFALAILAFYEEAVFRGFLIPRLEELVGKVWIAVVASALLFGSCHLYQGPLGATFAAGFGLLAGVLFAWRRNIWPLAVGHCAYNFALAFMSRQLT